MAQEFRQTSNRLGPNIGRYDQLYMARDLLWSDRPGRMVVLAASRTRPGLALDLGCGDGKNLVYLESLGWQVQGVDVSKLAIQAAERRIESRDLHVSRPLIHGDVRFTSFEDDCYDLVVAYGLYHCLDFSKAQQVTEKAFAALKPGGLLAFAAFNSDLPLPENHNTPELYLRPRSFVEQCFSRWRLLYQVHGIIEEDHLPVIGTHKHSLTWALVQKP